MREPASIVRGAGPRAIGHALRRVDGSERHRQELRDEGPQQMRLAVDQIRQRLRPQRLGDKIRHALPGIGDAARPAARVAGVSLGEALARVAREARRDQDQTIDIPQFRIRKTGEKRADQADQQRFPTSAEVRREARQGRNR